MSARAGVQERGCRKRILARPLPQVHCGFTRTTRDGRKLAGLELALLFFTAFLPMFCGRFFKYLKPYGFTHYSLHEEG